MCDLVMSSVAVWSCDTGKINLWQNRDRK